MIDVSRETSVTLQFSTEAGFMSWLVRYASHSDYSHVDFVLPDGRLLGARLNGGVAIRPAGYARFTKTHRIRMPTVHAPTILWAALNQRGKPYDVWAIGAFILPILRKGRRWRDPRAWECSELVAWAFERGGFFVGHGIALPPDKMTPGDALLVLSLFSDA